MGTPKCRMRAEFRYRPSTSTVQPTHGVKSYGSVAKFSSSDQIPHSYPVMDIPDLKPTFQAGLLIFIQFNIYKKQKNCEIITNNTENEKLMIKGRPRF
jgi:hypothetical protein